MSPLPTDKAPSWSCPPYLSAPAWSPSAPVPASTVCSPHAAKGTCGHLHQIMSLPGLSPLVAPSHSGRGWRVTRVLPVAHPTQAALISHRRPGPLFSSHTGLRSMRLPSRFALTVSSAWDLSPGTNTSFMPLLKSHG